MSLRDEIDNENTPTKKKPALKIDAGQDGGEFSGLVLENPLEPSEYEDAFAVVYRVAGLNPDDYRIVGDTVRFSVWNQSANVDGIRDLIVLYSYSARFQRISAMDRQTEATVNELKERLRKKRTTHRRTTGTGLGPECSFNVNFSDWQLAKPAMREEDPGKTGIEQTTLRVERAIELSKKRVKDLRRVGRNVTGIAIFHMGDPVENIADSYSSQTFGIEKNLTDQIDIALRLMVLGYEELLPLADSEMQDALYVLCNHGQFARRGTKTNITDDSDNVQNLLALLCKDWIVGPKFKDVRWHLPGDQMITTAEIAGVPVAAAHGHKITGSRDVWIQKQTTTVRSRRGTAPRLWITAHKHSQQAIDLGFAQVIQCATADGGSKQFEDSTGIYSIPGTTTLLIGNHDERGYSDLELL